MRHVSSLIARGGRLFLPLLVLATGLSRAACGQPPGAGAVAASAVPVIAYFVAEDARVAAIAFRIKTANLPLCARHGYDIGAVVHTLDAYALPLRSSAAASFGLRSEPAISAVVLGGPADLAGLRSGDRLVTADGEAFPTASAQPPRDGTYATTRAALDLIDRAAADGRLRLAIRRGDQPMAIDIAAAPSCAGRVQVMPSREMNSWADDHYATITTAMSRYAAKDEDLALIVGHELAHLFLGHQELLHRRPARPGLVLQSERDADYLGLYLAARAGFDISRAVDFWRRFEIEHDRAAFLVRTHPGGKERIGNAAATVAEIDALRHKGRDLVPQRALLGDSP